MKRYFNFIVRNPVPTILATLAVSAFFLSCLPRLDRDESVDRMLPERDEVLRYTREAEKVFGHDEFLVVAVAAPDPFTAETVGKVSRLSRELQFVPGVQEVISATNAKNFRGDPSNLWTEPLVDPARPPRSAEALARYRRELTGNDLFVRSLVSPEGTALGIVVRLAEDADKRKLVAAVQSVVDRNRGPERIVLSGSPAINLQVGRAMGRDMGRFFPLGIAVVLVSLALSFASVRGVALPFLTLLMTVLWTLGTMAALGRPISVIDTMLPTLLLAIGCSYGIHVMTEYYRPAPGEEEPRGRTAAAMTRIGPTVLGVGATTVAGFLSLALNDTPILRQFGAVAALGVVYAMVLCLTFLPASLSLLRLPAGGKRRFRLRVPLDPMLARIGALNRRRPAAVAGVGLLVAAAAFAGCPRLRIETNALNFFRPDDPVRADVAFVGRHFGGTIPLRTVIDTGRPGGALEPEVVAAMADYQAYLRTFPEVGKTVSVLDFVRSTNLALHGGDPAFDRLPAEPGKAEAYWTLYSLGSNPDDVRPLIDEERAMATVTARLQQVGPDGSALGTRRTAEIVAALEAYAAKRFPPGVRVVPTGRARDIVRTSDYLVSGFVKSLAGAVVPVLLVSAFLFRSLAGGAIALLPPALAIAINFGAMGWLGIPLDIATALVSSLAIGIGIDDTIHFILRYRERVRAFPAGAGGAMEEALREAGPPIVTSSTALAAGFAVLAVATFRPVVYFGGLTALAMVVTPLAALFVLPSALLLIRPRFLEAPAEESPGTRPDAEAAP
jgi:predicted RND superfamily exporter protein